jgi:HlyD family secretion protein
MKKRLPILILVLLIGVAAVYAWRNSKKEPDNRLIVSGNIELNEVNIAFKTPGRLLERTVDEGADVKKGQVLARLDREQLQAQRQRETAALASSESQLVQAQTAVEWQKATLAAEVEARRADLASAQARLAELRTGARPQEKRDAQASVEAAAAEAQRARRDWERAQTLHKNDDISTAQFDQYRVRAESADAQLKQANEREALVLAGPRAEQVAAQEAAVAHARAAVNQAEANEIEVRRRTEELTTRRAEIGRAKASVSLVDTQLDDTIAVSPVDGVVLVKSADPGEVLAAGTSVLTVGDIDHPWVRAYINEPDRVKIRLGQDVKVTTDVPGKVFHGKVTFISSQAEFTPKQIQTQQERVKLVYRIKIEVENPGRELKSNMPVDAEIVLGQ